MLETLRWFIALLIIGIIIGICFKCIPDRVWREGEEPQIRMPFGPGLQMLCTLAFIAGMIGLYALIGAKDDRDRVAACDDGKGDATIVVLSRAANADMHTDNGWHSECSRDSKRLHKPPPGKPSMEER